MSDLAFVALLPPPCASLLPSSQSLRRRPLFVADLIVVLTPARADLIVLYFRHNSREVILLDRERDEELDAIALSAQALVFHLKHLNGLGRNRKQQVHVDDMQIASLLALFVSDHFGGSDRSSLVSRTRRQLSASNYSKPFVCTCSTGTRNNICPPAKTSDSAEDVLLPDLCEKYLGSIKLKRNSIVVPLGTLRFGVCRHRALLMKVFSPV